MPFITARDDTKLHYKVWGEGPTVILIHGWPLNGDSWDAVTNALAEAGNRVIAYDRRGFGKSEQSWTGYDYDTFADDLAEVIAQAGGSGPVSLVGFSMGGGEIARYMSRHGGRNVSRAVLVSSVVPYMLRTDDNPDGVPQSQFDTMTEGMRQDNAHFMRSFFNDFYGVGYISSPVSEEVVMRSWGMAMQAGLRPTLAAAKAFATTDFRPDLPHFNVPTLIIHGTSDKTVPIDATGRAAAAAISGAQLIEYDGSPHGVFGSDQDRLIEDLKGFLSGAGGASPIETDIGSGREPAVREDALLQPF